MNFLNFKIPLKIFLCKIPVKKKRKIKLLKMVILIFKEAGVKLDLKENNANDVIHEIQEKFVSKN